MHRMILGGALAFAVSTTALGAAPVFQPEGWIAPADQVWLAKNDKSGKKWPEQAKGKGPKAKGNGNAGKGNAGKGKPDHAGPEPGKAGNGRGQAARDNIPDKPGKAKTRGPASANGHRAFTDTDRDDAMRRIVDVAAPDGRDMVRVLGTAGLVLATPSLVLSDVPDNELITYLNCPPGLAKKDPPCVPPGLAKNGVSADEWLAYDEEDYDEIWRERRRVLLDTERRPDADLFLLRSDQIATLFDLPAPPEGRRYALIDGMPVLLDEEDYTSLLLLKELARVTELDDGLRIAPTAALTQQELVRLYRLPAPGPDENYAVLNGQILRLNDAEYGILQLIRIARAFL